jgi:hypothetical protein
VDSAEAPAKPKKTVQFRWRRWNNTLHRDIGYTIFALTFIYAMSGVAVNHTHQWNPNYIVTNKTVSIGPVSVETFEDREAVEALLRGAQLPYEYRTTIRKGSGTVRIFLEDGTVDVDLATGDAEVELVQQRPVFHALNFLHLNHAKKLWTWVADAYAIMLASVALTGLFMRKGSKGLAGRGKWFVMAGIAVPVFFLFLYM